MKDKRQKMTLSWPCGDPVLAAYVLQAAAASGQLPYPGIFAAAAAASAPFGLLPPRPPPPPHPFAPTAAGLPCRPTPTLIPAPSCHPPMIIPTSDRKTPEEPTSEDETKPTSEVIVTSSTKSSSAADQILTTESKDRTRSSTSSLFQPYLDIEKK